MLKKGQTHPNHSLPTCSSAATRDLRALPCPTTFLHSCSSLIVDDDLGLHTVKAGLLTATEVRTGLVPMTAPRPVLKALPKYPYLRSHGVQHRWFALHENTEAARGGTLRQAGSHGCQAGPPSAACSPTDYPALAAMDVSHLCMIFVPFSCTVTRSWAAPFRVLSPAFAIVPNHLFHCTSNANAPTPAK